MTKVFQDENLAFNFDFSKALTVMQLSAQYQRLFLKDVDFIVETEGQILLVEYKNSTISGAAHPEAFENKIRSDEHYMTIARKYYDSLLYLMACNKVKPYVYCYILECGVVDSVARRMLTAKIKRQLPFELQNEPEVRHEMIADFRVLSIADWNALYGNDYPITPVAMEGDTHV